MRRHALQTGLKAVQRVIWANALIVIAAVFYTLAAGQRLGGQAYGVVIVVGLGALVAYLLDRLTDSRGGGAFGAFGAFGGGGADRHRKAGWVVCGVAGAIGVWVFGQHVPARAELALLAAAALSLGYALPCVPARGGWRRLRDVPYTKSVWVAGAWALATSVAPLLAAGAGWGTAIGWSLDRFMFIWAGVIPFDVRDLRRDRRDGVLTVPMRLGVPGTVAVCWGLLGLFAWHTLSTVGPTARGLAAVLPAVLVALWLLGLSKKRADAYYSVGLDGLVALQAFGLWLATGPWF